jgi:two-component system, cell cycle sensor histidine kinase and response regulator CckA
VREALELARGELEQREHPVHTELDLGFPWGVKTDAGFFRELIVNLLLSARDRMEGGGTLVVRTRPEGEGWLALRLEDGGPPYAQDELALLFDPLRKGEPGAPQFSLFLAVARAQVQRWGGELTVENRRDGSGASFIVRLPRFSDLASAAPPPSSPEPRMGPGGVPHLPRPARRVLVVDDDLDNARMMAEVLGEEGYDVQVAHSPDVALRIWDKHPYDAALLDAVMPEMTGWELARELRQRSPQALLAIVTGMDVRGQNRANLAQVDAVFRKPIDVGALDDFLSQVRGEGEEEAAPAEGPHDAAH